jgi:hypothetical protein
MNFFIKSTLSARGLFIGKRPLGTIAAESSGHQPAGSARIYSPVETIKSTMNRCRANTEFIDQGASRFSLTLHIFPAVNLF